MVEVVNRRIVCQGALKGIAKALKLLTLSLTLLPFHPLTPD